MPIISTALFLKTAGLFSLAVLFFALVPAPAQNAVIPGIDYMRPADAEIVDAQMAEAEMLDGGIRFRVDEAGEGPFIKTGDRVNTIYTGTLIDGTVFNRKSGRFHTYWFTVGAHPRQIIRGWEMSMHKMQKGGKYTIAIPSLYAYREKGRRGQVPPHATVIFEIEVLDVVSGG